MSRRCSSPRYSRSSALHQVIPTAGVNLVETVAWQQRNTQTCWHRGGAEEQRSFNKTSTPSPWQEVLCWFVHSYDISLFRQTATAALSPWLQPFIDSWRAGCLSLVKHCPPSPRNAQGRGTRWTSLTYRLRHLLQPNETCERHDGWPSTFGQYRFSGVGGRGGKYWVWQRHVWYLPVPLHLSSSSHDPSVYPFHSSGGGIDAGRKPKTLHYHSTFKSFYKMEMSKPLGKQQLSLGWLWSEPLKERMHVAGMHLSSSNTHHSLRYLHNSYRGCLHGRCSVG